MTDRITKAREAVLATVRMYAPIHASFSAEATRRLNDALTELHNAVVEATLAGMPQTPVASPVDPKATSIVKLNEPHEERQPDAVGEPEPHAPVPLPTPADQAAGKPVSKGKGKSSGKIDKPPQ